MESDTNMLFCVWPRSPSIMFLRFHMLACIVVWFFFYCCVVFSCMNAPQFIHSPVAGHLDCFQILAIMHKAAMKIYVQEVLWICFSILPSQLHVYKELLKTHQSG